MLRASFFRIMRGVMIGGCAIMLAGCASPAYRIKRNPDLFASFPPEVQQRVSEGLIDVGYTEDMVFIALGHPDRTYSRTTAQGVFNVWSYVDYDVRTERQVVDGRFRFKDADGRYRTAYDSIWVDVEHKIEYEKKRVEFSDGRVTSIEELSR